MCVCVGGAGCCPFSEAALRKAVCSFENSSYLLSPVPHRRKATGNICQRTRDDAIYSTLLLLQLRMKAAKIERGSGVQPVQRHWDSSKSELEREPERKEGGAGEGRMREREQRKMPIELKNDSG